MFDYLHFSCIKIAQSHFLGRYQNHFQKYEYALGFFFGLSTHGPVSQVLGWWRYLVLGHRPGLAEVFFLRKIIHTFKDQANWPTRRGTLSLFSPCYWDVVVWSGVCLFAHCFPLPFFPFPPELGAGAAAVHLSAPWSWERHLAHWCLLVGSLRHLRCLSDCVQDPSCQPAQRPFPALLVV